MEEKEELKLKLFKHIIYNIFVFISIFIVFGLFVFFMVKNNIYSNVNKELYESKERILELEELEEFPFDFITDRTILRKNITDILSTNNANVYSITSKIVNPSITVIVRDEEGNIINTDFGKLSEYSNQIEFNLNNLDKIYELTINNKYSYRGLNFLIDSDKENEDRYVQLLINTTSEKYLVSQYFGIIATAVVVGCILSIFASYILSKKTLKPLSDNLIRQMEFVQNVSHELRTPLTICTRQRKRGFT